MECYNQYNEPLDLDSEPFTMPTRVVLDLRDNEDLVMETLQTRYDRIIDSWQQQESDHYQSRETRYDNEADQPTFPVITRQVRQSGRTAPTVVLPDGRRAKLLDANRVQTLCGIQEILPLNTLHHPVTKSASARRCPLCGGHHLTDQRTTQPPAGDHSTTSVPCPKCHSNLVSASYWDGPDTIVCIPCGHRLARPVARLSHDEEQANHAAITHLLATLPEIASDQSDDDECDIEDMGSGEEDREPDEVFDWFTPGEDTQDLASPYEDQLSIETAPETTPLDLTELLEIHDLLQHPSTRLDSHSHSIVIQQLLALTAARLDDPTNDQAFTDVFSQVVAEEVGQLGDLLHDPACHLFKASRSPLRQELLDRAIQRRDSPDFRMAVWAAAGRFLKETHLDWLKDYHAAVTHDQIPTDRKARARFWTQLQATKKQEVQPIIDWLLALSKEDLSILCGDPDSTHPFLHHPDPTVFQRTDTLLLPLMQFLANELQRFRQKPAGCALLAGDYGFDVKSLTEIAIQSGQLPECSATAASRSRLA